jgi:hypothetical protein
MKLTLPKWGFGSPSRLPKLLKFDRKGQNTSHMCVFYIVEKLSSVDVEMGSHGPFGQLYHTLWQKQGPGIKLAV